MSFSATTSGGAYSPPNGAISQELHRTAQPLTALLGLLELALEASRTTDEYRDIIRQAMEQSQRVSGCFDQVRELFHSQEPQRGAARASSGAEPRLEIYQTPGIEGTNV